MRRRSVANCPNCRTALTLSEPRAAGRDQEARPPIGPHARPEPKRFTCPGCARSWVRVGGALVEV